MAGGIFWVLLVLMAPIDVNQPLFSSEDNGIAPENTEEILQRMKEQKASLWLQQLCLKKGITDLEARQESLARPALEVERQIQWYMCKVLSLAVITLFKLWRQHLQEAICQHSGEETDLALLGKEWKGVAFPDKTLGAK